MGIVGYGTVGRATASLFRDVAIYDPYQGYDDLASLADRDVVFVCVPTPNRPDGHCDLSAVYDAVRRVVPRLSERQVVAIRSTVPPGTARRLQEAFPNTHFAANPEFLRAHRLEEDAKRPSRVVIGADTVFARQSLLRAYHSCFRDRVPYLVTDSLTAEFIKYAANCFLATKILYARELRRAAKRLGVSFGDVVMALGLDPRIGGGEEWWLEGLQDECLPKDLEAFVHFLRSRGIERELLETLLRLRDSTLMTEGAPSEPQP